MKPRRNKWLGVGLSAGALLLIARAPGRAQSSPTPLTAEPPSDIWATAPLGTTPSDLGRYFTADFSPLAPPTADQFARLTTGRRPADHTTIETRVVASDNELRANASAWGLVAGGFESAHAQRHATYRGIEMTGSYAIDDPSALAPPPERARWYIAQIVEGRMVEAHFSSENTQRINQVSARIPVIQAGGTIADFARANNLNASVSISGLVARGPQTLAPDAAAFEAAYAPDAQPPGAILVRFSPVSRPARPWAFAGSGACAGSATGRNLMALSSYNLSPRCPPNCAPTAPIVPGATDARALVEIDLRSGEFVDRLGFRFTGGGLPDYLPSAGGNGGQPFSWALLSGERIVRISGRAGAYVDAIQFHTDTPRDSLVFGGPGGAAFDLSAPPGLFIVGLVAAYDAYVTRVCVLYGR